MTGDEGHSEGETQSRPELCCLPVRFVVEDGLEKDKFVFPTQVQAGVILENLGHFFLSFF